jgi:hypothetical protein
LIGLGGPSEPERYEPLPGLAELPRWLWNKMGRGLRIGAALLLVALVAVGIALAPGISETKKERSRSEQSERAEQREALIRRLQRQQQPRFATSASVAPATAADAVRLRARAGLLDDLSASILADSRRRVREGELEGPIRRIDCEPFPRSVKSAGAEADVSRRRGRYVCIAVTADFKPDEASIGGAIGHPYRAAVDFETGRYAYCKIAGQAGPTAHPLVVTPKACGG